VFEVIEHAGRRFRLTPATELGGPTVSTYIVEVDDGGNMLRRVGNWVGIDLLPPEELLIDATKWLWENIPVSGVDDGASGGG
jgi:hypothetical protein